MADVPENIVHILTKLVPSSTFNEIVSFVFYDNHPNDERKIDVTVCTKNGEVKEFYKRELITSTSLNTTLLQIQIYRNSKCELFYLISNERDFFILSGKNKLQVVQKITDVDYYDIVDLTCSGQACLKIVRKDDAVPMFFDDKLEHITNKIDATDNEQADESLPIITDLKRKLIEAKYSIKCNENTYQQLLRLRQLAAYTVYKEIRPNENNTVFNSDHMVANIKIKTTVPWVRIYNEKIIIVFHTSDERNKNFGDFYVLLHGTTRNSVVYSTKLFRKIPEFPYWREQETQECKSQHETAIVAVMDLKEIKQNITSRIEFNGVICSKENHLLPFDNVYITALDTMEGQLDILSSKDTDERSLMLALLATSEKTDLILRHIKKEGEPDLVMSEIFSEYLKMDKLATNNVVVFRQSAYHVLYGVTIVFYRDPADTRNCVTNATVYARSSSQVLSLIHYAHDAIPYNILITTKKQKITAKQEQLSIYNDNVPSNFASELSYKNYIASFYNQILLILNYLDQCRLQMFKSKDEVVRSKIGAAIDLFIDPQMFKAFRSNWAEEAMKATKMLVIEDIMFYDTETDSVCESVDESTAD